MVSKISKRSCVIMIKIVSALVHLLRVSLGKQSICFEEHDYAHQLNRRLVWRVYAFMGTNNKRTYAYPQQSTLSYACSCARTKARKYDIRLSDNAIERNKIS